MVLTGGQVDCDRLMYGFAAFQPLKMGGYGSNVVWRSDGVVMPISEVICHLMLTMSKVSCSGIREGTKPQAHWKDTCM